MRRTPLRSALLFALIAPAACQTPAEAPAPPPAPAASAAAPAQPAAAPAPAPPAAEAEDSFEPARGVRCHRGTHTCEWRGGASAGLTRIFFGDSAADALDASLAPAYPYDPIFKPSPTQSCDTLVTTCYDRGGASADVTRQYFGAEAARRLGERSSSIVRYGAWVTCDKVSKVCYDRLGASVGVTRLYLGEPESERLVGRLRAREG